MSHFRSNPSNTPVRCRFCDYRTTEAMADVVRETTECDESPHDTHDFKRVRGDG